MSNQTVSSNKNFDDATIAGLTNGDDITIDTGATLTINSDVRWGQNAAVIGNMTISATSGGKILIDGTTVWWVPFDASSGNVPALGTCGTPDVTRGGNNVGEFLGIWSALGTVPMSASEAMPTDGFIKLRSATATFADNDILTFSGGATATLSTSGQRGWIHVVGEEATTITVPRLGELCVTGDWFQIGETNGSDDQTFQYPVTDNCPCIFVEDTSGSYEVWLNAGNRWGAASVTVSQDARGKFFGCDNATGVITIARRSSNACGYKPSSGRKVYIPNVIISNSTSSNWLANTINATLGTRWDLTTTGGGKITLDKCVGAWYIGTVSAYSVSLTNSGFLSAVSIDTTSTTTIMTLIGIGAEGAGIASQPLQVLYGTTGTTLTKVTAMRYESTSTQQSVMFLRGLKTVTVTDSILYCFHGASANTHWGSDQRTLYLLDCQDTTVTRCAAVGAAVIAASSTNTTFTDIQYADCMYGTTQTTNSYNGAMWFFNSCHNITVSGFSNFSGIADIHPYTCMIVWANGSNGLYVKNIGTPVAEYDCGSSNACGAAVYISNAGGVIVRRVYVKNSRQTAFLGNYATSDFLVENVWGDAADSSAYAGLNGIVKGGRATLAAGGSAATYGVHWVDHWTGTTTGRLCVLCNEPSATSLGQCSITAGTPLFTGAGNVIFPAMDDQITWAMPYYMLGATSFANTSPTLTGTNTGYCTYEFQYDTSGTWNGSWLTLNGTNLSGIGAINPATGIKLKIRATRASGATVPVLTQIRIDTVTDSTSQQIEYPLPQDSIGTISNLTVNSHVQIYNTTTSAEIYNGEVNAISYTYTYTNGLGVTDGDVIRVRVTNTNGVTAKLPFESSTTATAAGWSVYAQQVDDPIYNTWALDGSAMAAYSISGSDIYIAQGSYTKKSLGAWYSYYLTTSNGIANFWDAFTFVSVADIQQNVSIKDVKLYNPTSNTAVIFTDNDVRYYRSDFTSPYDTSATGGSIYMDYSGVPLVNLNGSALTPAQQAELTLAAENSVLIPGLM